MSKEETKITDRFSLKTKKTKQTNKNPPNSPKHILLIIDNYLKIFNIGSFLINLQQATEFTPSFWEASWQAKMEIAGS